ncbi:putative hexokinase [Rosa chinensis]|uniref:Putative hexokinase n=1 Tax=Rosa chinensis TaxID=74649 RepID=A0A2P6PRP3_ROSCH|nr:putative hexokinase [Rosa chinensis]
MNSLTMPNSIDFHTPRILAQELCQLMLFKLLMEMQAKEGHLLSMSEELLRANLLMVMPARSRWLWSRFIPQSSNASPVKGLYIYGGVGTGKTMLMDLFFDQLQCNWRKKRIHFHDFMLNVHSCLRKHQDVEDPLEVVAGEISDEAVTNVADALILNRLFGHLFDNGVILVATSNRAPDNLYERGLQRDLFLPFIAALKVCIWM